MTTETTTTVTAPKKRGRPAKGTVKTTVKSATKTTPKPYKSPITKLKSDDNRIGFVARIHDLECEVERLHAVIGKMYLNRTYA